LLHIDFAFWNIFSHRGFTEVLTILDACSRFIWLFCTESKKPPIHMLRWFIANLHREDHTLARIRVNEDGALEGSTAFASFIRDEAQLNLETTGGCASFLNVRVERPNRILAERARCVLLNAGAPSMDWCYATEHAADTYRITLNFALKCSPHTTLYGDVPLYKDMHVWGCRIRS
jgi:hypothetical protein